MTFLTFWMPKTWFHVKYEWQANCKIFTLCCLNFTFWNFLEHSAVVVKDNFDDIIASSNRNTNTNLKEKSMIVALTAMVSTSNRWEPFKKTRTFSWHSLTNILPQCRSLCSNMNVCSAMAMACATCSKMAKPWAALLRVIFSKSVPVNKKRDRFTNYY